MKCIVSGCTETIYHETPNGIFYCKTHRDAFMTNLDLLDEHIEDQSKLPMLKQDLVRWKEWEEQRNNA